MEKSISHTTDMMQTFYIQRPMYYELWDYEPRVLVVLKYQIVFSLVLSLNLWGWKSISHTADMTQTSYIQHLMYMTPPILKLKLRKKSDLRLWTEGLGHAEISNCIFMWCKLEFMGLKKHFTHYQYDANFLYPTSYVYDLTNTKTETKEEIWL